MLSTPLQLQTLIPKSETLSAPAAVSQPATKNDGLDPALVKAARQFEGLFIEMMLQSMRDATPSDDLMGGAQMETYRGMHNREIAKSMTETGGLGLADVILTQIRQAQAVDQSASSEAADASAAAQRTGAALPEQGE